MRRVHFPLRSPTPVRRWESKGRAWAAYKSGHPSSRNVSTKPESPRIVFSGIQPTGIPHVRTQTRFIVHAMLTMASAWKLFWGACELGRVAVYCSARRQAPFLHRWLACPHTTPGPHSPLRGTGNHDGTHTRVWHRSTKIRRFPSG
jgi:hypothetical protein